MDQKFINSISKAWQEVVEKKKLDPVGKADADIDNDGDVDSSDSYLHNRRKTIKKAMKKEEKCSTCGMMNCKCKHEAADLDADNVEKALRHDCATHVTSEQWGYGECISGEHTLVEQEDGSAIVTHYDVMFEHGIEKDVPVEDLTILVSEAHMHASKKKKGMTLKAQKACEETEIEEGVFSDDKRREHEKAADHHAAQASHHTTQMNKAKKAGAHPSEYDHHKVLAKMHDRAQASHGKAVVHSRRGEHDRARSHSQIAHGHSDAVKKKAATYESVQESYQTVAETHHEVQDVYASVRERAVMAMKAMWEKKEPSADKKASHKPGEPEETMKDKLKGGGAVQMAKDLDAAGTDKPKVPKGGEDEVGHDDASKAGRVTKQSPARPGDKR